MLRTLHFPGKISTWYTEDNKSKRGEKKVALIAALAEKGGGWSQFQQQQKKRDIVDSFFPWVDIATGNQGCGPGCAIYFLSWILQL
jgi:hypothetical protein